MYKPSLKTETMAVDTEAAVSLSQHLQEADEILKEFGSVISSVSSHGPQDEIFEQMKQIDNEIEMKVKTLKDETSNNRKAVEELKAEKEALEFRIGMHKKSIDLSEDELSHLLKEKTQLNKVPVNEIKALKVKQLEAEDLMFRKHLGMEIRKVKGGCLQVAFNQIDQKQPNSLFLFSLTFDENRQYVITDCKPPISDLDDIVLELNTDNNFRKFVHTMRKRFRECVA